MADRFSSWEGFLRSRSEREIVALCRSRAKQANKPRALFEAPDRDGNRINPIDDVLDTLLEAEGRCFWCGSLAVHEMTPRSD